MQHEPVDPLTRIEQIGDFEDFSIRSAMVAFLARPGRTQNLEAARVILGRMVAETGTGSERTRLEAARLLTSLPDQFDAELSELLRDVDPEVVRHAIRAVGNKRKRRFVFLVLSRLGDPYLTADAVEALSRFGERIVGTLGDHLLDPTIPIEVRREIPGVLVAVGTASAERVLVESLLESDTRLRFRIISALNKLHQSRPELPLDTQMIETVLAAEIIGHYRSYQILGTLSERLESDDPVPRALHETMDQEVERIFRLLALLYPRYDLHGAYIGLQSSDRIVHDNALEFLDNILKPQLQRMLVPLLDSEVTTAERVALANRVVGARMETQEQALVALIQSDDPWLRSCAAYAIGALEVQSLAPELDRWIDDPDPLLRETARQAKLRFAM
jgi:AAA family ATP:ADP antiporter